MPVVPARLFDPTASHKRQKHLEREEAMERVRIGVLGAARIVSSALLAPARKTPQVQVSAIAARDQQRAQAFARKHAIPRVVSGYEQAIADPEIDAVYIPLPNGLHARWAIKALEAGKHVLCEKPFASNAQEAQAMAEAAERSRRVLMEAFHYRYHPMAARMREVVQSGMLGKIGRIETWMCFPLPEPRNIRYQYDLGGGATMDAGCYAINMLRLLAGDEPEVVSARARLFSPQVDRWMQAEFRFADGRTGQMTASMLSRPLFRIAARVQGDQGEMYAFNPVLPQLFHRLKIRTAQGTRIEHFTKEPTYLFQLRAFASAVLEGTPSLTTPADAVANMRVIDAVYEKAGLALRGKEALVSVRS